MKFKYKTLLLIFFVINSSCIEVIDKKEVIEEQQKVNKTTFDLLPRIMSNKAIDLSLDEITVEEYDRLKGTNKHELVLFSNSDSIENILKEKHPILFKKQEGKFKFKTENSGEVTLFNNLTQGKEYSKYEVKATFNNYIIFNYSLYESWYVVLVNVKTQKSYVLPGKPNFVNNEVFYGYSNYYGEEELVLIDTKREAYITLTFDDTIIINSYSFNNHIRFETQDFSLTTKKYFQIGNNKTSTN